MLRDNPHVCILLRGTGRPRAGALVAFAPRIKVFTTRWGDATQAVVPLTIYQAVQALGYHHLGDVYAAQQRVVGERSLKKGHTPAKVSLALKHGFAAAMMSWRPSSGHPHRGGRPLQKIGRRALCWRTRGSGRQGQGGQTHQNEDRALRGVCGQGHFSHQGRHGGREVGNAAHCVLPAPGCAAEQHQTAPPLGGPLGRAGASQCTSSRPAAG